MKLKLDHVGYITSDIEKTAIHFGVLGYEIGEIIDFPKQLCKVCMLICVDGSRVELVQPYENNKGLNNILKKRGVSPYHVCYEVEDINLANIAMINAGNRQLFEPIKAPAFDNRMICYFWNSELGYIELVQK